ncbi:MAG TPA: alpha/beta hydrolase [Gemmatimonadaceae bacterium]|nr:alpha/beta hydrolase [Gemmatimonadaceae bacterium]
MPSIKTSRITMYYEQQGDGEPLILIPYLAADNACYAFQLPEYAKHFRCLSVDLRGTGQSEKPDGAYTTEQLADDIAAFMQALGIERAHIFGLSLGAAVGMWLGAKYPDKVQSLSLHSPWDKSDHYIETLVNDFQVVAEALESVPEMIVRSLLHWCLSADLYNAKPDYIRTLEGFIRSRPAMPLPAFLLQSGAAMAHDVTAQLGRITAPTQVTFGALDLITSTRFVPAIQKGIANSELIVFDGCAHAALYEKVEEFNQKTVSFLLRHTMAEAAQLT